MFNMVGVIVIRFVDIRVFTPVPLLIHVHIFGLLGMAAHLEGKGVVTQDAGGLAQKGGATWSHIQIANRPEATLLVEIASNGK